METLTLVALSLAAAAAGAFARRAAGHRSVGGLAAAGVIGLGLPPMLLLGLFAMLFTTGCADACRVSSGEPSRPGVPWWDTADARQWDVQFWVGWGAVAAYAVAVLTALRPRLRVTLAAAVTAAGLAAGWLMLLAPSGRVG